MERALWLQLSTYDNAMGLELFIQLLVRLRMKSCVSEHLALHSPTTSHSPCPPESDWTGTAELHCRHHYWVTLAPATLTSVLVVLCACEKNASMDLPLPEPHDSHLLQPWVCENLYFHHSKPSSPQYTSHASSRRWNRPGEGWSSTILGHTSPDKELQRFLGLTNFYMQFIKNYNQIAYPLNSLLRTEPKSLSWNHQATVAIQW